MLPMGTIMTACMGLAIGVALVATVRRHGDSSAAPGLLMSIAGAMVLLAGLWNTFWYALRHLGEHWGHAALGSGLLMLAIAACLLIPARLPALAVRALPVFAVLLAGFAWHYGSTLARL